MLNGWHKKNCDYIFNKEIDVPRRTGFLIDGGGGGEQIKGKVYVKGVAKLI